MLHYFVSTTRVDYRKMLVLIRKIVLGVVLIIKSEYDVDTSLRKKCRKQNFRLKTNTV